MKRWCVLIAGVVLQAVLGGVYAWSVFIPPLVQEYGLSIAQGGFVFGLTIAVFTMTMNISGQYLHAVGPRVMAGCGAILFALGYMVASLSQGHYALILLGTGVLVGTGIGAGYVCPLTVTMKWFPRSKGLVTGIAVAGFGGGAVILSMVAQYLLRAPQWDVLIVFRFIGIVFGGVAFAAALVLRFPNDSDGVDALESGNPAPGNDLKRHVFSMNFGLLALGMLTSTFAGLLTVGNLKPIMLRMGLSDSVATLTISFFAIGNTGGRIIWGHVHDRLGSQKTVVFSLVILGLALVPLSLILTPGCAVAAVVVAGFGFGACFVVYASSIVDFFGIDLFPRLYPLCFLGYGLAGVIGPGAGGWLADATGSFSTAIFVSAGLVLAAAGLISWGFHSGRPEC